MTAMVLFKHKHYCFLFVVCLSLFVSADDFSIVEQRLLATLIPTTPSSLSSLYSAAKGYSDSLQDGGFWKDISMFVLSLIEFVSWG
jgi:hypothetical protein